MATASRLVSAVAGLSGRGALRVGRRSLLACSSSSLSPVLVADVDRILAAAEPTTNTSVRCFSSSLRATANAAAAKNVVSVPSNLSFDAKSTCSPFYGLERVGGEQEDETVEEQTDTDNERDEDDDKAEDIDGYSDDEADVDEEDEEEEEESRYDLTTRPEPQYAIPLPDRLRVPILNLPTSEEVGTIHLSEDVFGMNPIRPDLLQRVVQWQRNKKRGKRKAKTKTISEVSGSGRKVRSQKGGGVARAGHRRPAHWRGGAKAHGPKGSIQDYTTKLNKKVRKLGLKHALSQKLKEGNLILLSDLVLETHKTKNLAAILDRYDIGGKYGATAFVLDHSTEDDVKEEGEVVVTPNASMGGINVNFRVASRNLYKVKVVNQLGGNVYDILKHEKLVLTLGAMEAIEARLTK